VRQFKLYAAGKMSGLTYELMNTWRLDVEKLLGQTGYNIRVVNPVSFYNFELDPTTYTDKEVMDFDLYQVRDSDLVLVNLDFPDSLGTAVELFYAHNILRIPVVAFGTTKNHPWIECCINKRCETLEDAVDYIVKFYLRVH